MVRKTDGKRHIIRALIVMAFMAVMFTISAYAAKAPALSEDKLTMKVDTAYRLKLSGEKQDVKWKSTNSDIVALDKQEENSILLRAKKAGSCSICCFQEDGKKLWCKVTVKKRKHPYLVEDEATIKYGTQYTIHAKNASGARTRWKTSNRDVAWLSQKQEGSVVVTAKGRGTATVSGYCKDGTVLQFKVHVTKQVKLLFVDKVNTEGAALLYALRSLGASVDFVAGDVSSIDHYDGLVLPGGGDVSPSYSKVNGYTYGVRPSLDQLQMRTIKRFVDQKKPILGICRGHQLLNVYFGGTLRNISGHAYGGSGRLKPVKVTAKNSMAADVYGSGAVVTVRHSHHQAVGKLAKDLVVTMVDSGDGVVEAIQHKKLPIYGYQWHPEKSSRGSAPQEVLKEFVNICNR